MYSLEEHLDNLTRHINLVRDNCCLLGKRLISSGRKNLGRLLIANGFVHDASKFKGIEWKYLHTGPDTPRECLDLAVEQHVKTNPHHPEYWGDSISKMPDVYLAEAVCDWYARATEFGTDLRAWIKDTAIEKWSINEEDQTRIAYFVDLLLQNSFVGNS